MKCEGSIMLRERDWDLILEAFSVNNHGLSSRSNHAERSSLSRCLCTTLSLPLPLLIHYISEFCALGARASPNTVTMQCMVPFSQGTLHRPSFFVSQ